MSGLAEFLIARIAEDEEAAREAAGSPFKPGNPGAHWVAGETNNDGVRRTDGIPVCGHSWPHEMDHIARWDPARVLAECAAKRGIVELHRVSVTSEWVNPPDGPAYQEPERTCAICGWVPDACDTVKALALPFADHADYRQEWAVQ